MKATTGWLWIAVLWLTWSWPGGLVWADASVSQDRRLEIQAAFERLPQYFIENRGQVDKRVKFYSQNGSQTTWFTKDGVVVSLARQKEQPKATEMKRRPSVTRLPGSPFKTTAVGLRPVGLRKEVKITALEPQEYKVNYFIGNDPNKWHTDISTYKAVAYREAYKGIDLKFYGDGRQLEYDIIVKPGADPNQVKFQYAGVKGLEVTPAGDLALKLPDGGVLVQKKPYVYQEIAGVRVPREAAFKIAGDVAGYTYGFEVAAYDKKAPLIIDPVLIYSNNMGGSSSQRAESIQVDGAGCAYVAGETDSTDFPTVNYYEKSLGGSYLGSYFVCKFNAAGNGLVYSTYLRGTHSWDGTPANDAYYSSGWEGNHLGLAVDASGCAYVTGATWSKDWPTVNPAYTYQTKAYGSSSFVTKLAAAGNTLVYSTYMHSNMPSDTTSSYSHEYARDIALGENGTVYVAGSTDASSFNGTGIGNGGWIGFVTKLNASGNTFLWTKGLAVVNSANEDTNLYRIVAEPYVSSSPHATGGVWLTGETENYETFPLKNALQTNFGSGYSTAFLTYMDSGGNIQFSTYWGGTTAYDSTTGYGIARGGSNGDIFVCGSYIWGAPDPTVDTRTFPTSTNALKRSMGLVDPSQPPANNMTAWNSILFRVTNQWSYNGSSWTFKPQLVYSTYCGGNYEDEAYAVAADQYGNAYITGDTLDDTFPLVQPLYTSPSVNIYVSKIAYNASSNKMRYVYSTYIGDNTGGPDSGGYSIVVDGKHNAYVAGNADQNGFPLIHNVASPGYGVMVFKIRDTIPLAWVPILLAK